jgi:hypothetical protein
MPDEVEVCLVCCEDLRVVAVGSCNHRSVCALCSVRMRQLIGDSACILCKRTLEHVVMTADSDKSFDDFQIWNNVCKVQGRELLFDEPSQAFFDDEKMLNEIKFLRSFACPRCPPPPARGSFVAKDRKDLKQHTETHHGVTHCALCVEFRKEFVQEQQMYKRNELKLHEKSGDQVSGGSPKFLCCTGDSKHAHARPGTACLSHMQFMASDTSEPAVLTTVLPVPHAFLCRVTGLSRAIRSANFAVNASMTTMRSGLIFVRITSPATFARSSEGSRTSSTGQCCLWGTGPSLGGATTGFRVEQA